MITIEDTYKETEEKMDEKYRSKLQKISGFENENCLPNNYLINHMEMNVIEEQVDEENKSCVSSFRRSNNASNYASGEHYAPSNSAVSKEGRKGRESFETFGQKSLTGVINTIKSESR